MSDTYTNDRRYLVGDLLSDESTTEIREACDRSTGDCVVIKYPKPGCVQTVPELACLSRLSHPRMIALIDRLDTPNGPALVLPYARGGDLFGWICGRPLLESEVRRVMYHILTAVAHLHRHGFWHRDIKPENILVMTETFNPDAVVLADFGYCQRLGCIQCCNECCGSPHYFAPELVRQVAYTEKVDIWALGITMFACLTSALPYDASDLGAMFEAILDGLPELFNNETVARTSDACREFLDALLDPDPAMRPTAEQALAHHWFAEMSAGGIGRATARVPAALPVISA